MSEYRLSAREILEGYGELLQKSRALSEESDACRQRLERDGTNAGLWLGKARRLQAEALRLQRLARRRQLQAEGLLARLPDAEGRAVLSLRYISLMRYEEIGEVLGYSPRHIYRLHLRAVQRLQQGIR